MSWQIKTRNGNGNGHALNAWVGRPRLIDPLHDEVDRKVVLMGACGLALSFIARENNLTIRQVSYRLKFAGVKVGDFRNGQNIVAQRLMEQLPGRAQLLRELRERLKLTYGQH